jgi:hypothetical protein
MMPVFPQVRTDDEKGHASEKDGPVADIQAANSLNSKGNHSLNHDQLLKAFVALFFLPLRRDRTISIQSAIVLGNKNRVVRKNQKRQGVFLESKPHSSSGVGSNSRRRGHDTSAAIHNKRHAPNPQRKAVPEFILVGSRFSSG